MKCADCMVHWYTSVTWCMRTPYVEKTSKLLWGDERRATKDGRMERERRAGHGRAVHRERPQLGISYFEVHVIVVVVVAVNSRVSHRFNEHEMMRPIYHCTASNPCAHRSSRMPQLRLTPLPERLESRLSAVSFQSLNFGALGLFKRPARFSNSASPCTVYYHSSTRSIISRTALNSNDACVLTLTPIDIVALAQHCIARMSVVGRRAQARSSFCSLCSLSSSLASPYPGSRKMQRASTCYLPRSSYNSHTILLSSALYTLAVAFVHSYFTPPPHALHVPALRSLSSSGLLALFHSSRLRNL